MGVFRKSCVIALIVLTVWLVGLGGFYAINELGMGNNVTVCISPSMEPFIKTNGFVVTDNSVPFSEIEVGDIVLFDAGIGRFVNHRVHQITYINGEKAVMTVGDNNSFVDVWVTTEKEYIGEVVGNTNVFMPLVSWVCGDIRENNQDRIAVGTISFLLCYLSLCLIVFWDYVKKIIKYCKEDLIMNDVWMEKIHGRRNRNKTNFKGVINKVIVSGVILATVLGSTTPALAADLTIREMVNGYNGTITQEYGVSIEMAISNVENTIVLVKEMRNEGYVSSSVLKELASKIYSLETAMKSNGNRSSIASVKSVLDSAEKAVDGLSNASEVEIAITIVRSSLGLDAVETVQYRTANELKSFSDVPTSHWAHDAIMAMVQRGMISGTTTPVNGVGTYAPNATMTRAQFVTVVTRYLFADEVANYNGAGEVWYAANYDVAISEGLIKESEFSIEEMNEPMTRQEMAMVLVRAMEELGEDKGTLISTSRIPDYNQIGTYYRNYVQIAYSKGFITGVDTAGTFSPMGTLNRAQAATVLYRLVEADTRADVDLTSPTQTEGNQQATGTQVFYEGQKHDRPQAGDVVIKSDGTRVTIQYDEYGILRAPGCDIYTGVVINGVTVKEGMASYYDQRPFRKDAISGEMLSVNDWNILSIKLDPNGKFLGDYDGEIMNTWYKWSEKTGLWLWIGPMG